MLFNCDLKPAFGQMHPRFERTNSIASSKSNSYFAIMYAITIVELLEIPAAQCTSIFSPFYMPS